MQEQTGPIALATPRPDALGLGLHSTASAPWPQARDIGRMLRRRIGLIVLLAAMLNGFAVWAVSQIKPRFTAEASVLVGLRQQQVVDLKAVLAGLSGESDVIESEIQLIKSRDVARRIVRAHDLDKLPEFNPELAPPGLMTRLHSFIANKLAGTPQGPLETLATPSAAPAPAVRDPLGPVVDEFSRHLWVAPRGRSRVLSISFESADPALAATIANAVADAYIANQLREKTEATADAHRWLNERVAELREQVLNADAAVVAYQRKSGLTEGRQGSLVVEQITQLSEQMIKAAAAEADAQARLRETESSGQHSAGLELVVASAHDRTEMLRNALTELRGQLNNGNESEVELHALQHEADADRALYDRLLARLKETNIEAGLQTPDAQVISRAEAPEQPTFPKRSLILPVVFIATLVIIGLLVMGLEGLDQGISSLEQIERMFGVPAIGALPNVRRRLFGHSPERPTAGRAGAALGESLRGLYTGLQLSSTDASARVVLVASALPREGRTSMILAMARMLAQSGKRVLIIDTDLRRGQLHRICGVSRKPGLIECLHGTTPLAEALTRDPETAVCLLTAGETGGVSPDVLGSPEMGQLLRKFSTVFDMVLLDSAPLLEVADARNLCRWADRTIMLVRWRDTRREAVAAGLRQVLEAGGSLAGCVLTLVDPKRYRHYGDRGLYAQRGGLYLLK